MENSSDVDQDAMDASEGDTIYYTSDDGLLTHSGVLMKKEGEGSRLVLACRAWEVPGAPVFIRSIREEQVQCVAPRAGRKDTR